MGPSVLGARAVPAPAHGPEGAARHGLEASQRRLPHTRRGSPTGHTPGSGPAATGRRGVQLSYAIGVAKLVPQFLEAFGTEQGKLTSEDSNNVLKMEFDCRPGAIAMALALREPKYQETAAYCHFGRESYTKDGIKFFEWENAKDVNKYATMSSAEITAALKASNYLTKWVD